MNLKRWLISLGALLSVALIFGFVFKPAASSKEQPSSFSGIVEQEEYQLSFKIGGRVGGLSVEEGQAVKQGDVIGYLEKGEWQNKVDQAQAAVALAEANVNKAVTGVGVVDKATAAKVEQAQAALKTAEAQVTALKNGVRPEQLKQLEAKVTATEKGYRHAEEMLGKMQQLFEAGAIPQTQKDETELALEKAKAEYEVAQKELEMARAGARQEDLDKATYQAEQARGALHEALSGKGQVQLSSDDIQIAKGQLAQAQATLEETLTYLSYTELRAPVDGIVVRKNVKAGEMVSEGFTAITLAQPDAKSVKFFVPENQLKGLQTGQQINLSVPAIEVQTSGIVESVNPAPQFAVQKATNHLNETDVRSFEVRVKITEHTEQILAGMTAVWQGDQPE
ncbi:hypothetical protein BEP19_08890 [Ammoniphilus oxalaticus]|uniref:YbhG-like alpha-helical hairpin domain-containing protein n=1 Tax=Ammoniphilus oxalaticus TaxID=66863 RepID=A0A419SKL8_9BACL|nr:HlyD family secretion protein [Ammoniphilus oxalaticus]RKD24490.1 hypothetical protein BEP19_08890 [Ammoniphilus oxalaticus]